MRIIAKETLAFESPCSQNIYCFTPAICQLQNGRLLMTFDLGGAGVDWLTKKKCKSGEFGLSSQGNVYVSDDNGNNWRHTGNFPMLHARPFVAGDCVYLIGHNGKLGICVSRDWGETWSRCTFLDDNHQWHQSACAVDYRHGRVYLTMEQVISGASWPGVAPVLMSAEINRDLTMKENWTFSNPLKFDEHVKLPDFAGIPFYPTGNTVPDTAIDTRFCGDPCWLESHVLRIYDPNHILYDASDRTVMLWMRCHTGLTNIAAIAKGVENSDKSLTLSLVETPAGTPLVFVSCPGGQMKFYIIYDDVSRLYWLVSSQATDSMTRPDLLPEDRYGLPDNERHRLQLHFSKNLFDWCFAGIVSNGSTAKHSRHYASMVIAGNDLCIVSRSGDHRAKSAHNGNLITFHKVLNFRTLIY